MSKNREYKFIFEETNIVEYEELKILNESTVNNKPKLTFEANLQTADMQNNNKRVYNKPICETIVSKLSDKANRRSLLMEIDHPLFISDKPEVLKKRSGIVEVNNSAAVIRKLGMKGKQIFGEIETLSGFKGPDFANLLSKDKVNIGFSLRALGSVEQMSDGTLMVKDPIMPITYDIVSNPSYSNSRVMDFLPETSTEFAHEAGDLMYENDQLILLQEDKITIDNGDSVMTFLNEVIEDEFVDIIRKGISFKI